ILIRGLRHENLRIRQGSIKVLQNVTKLYFGYRATHPKDRREFHVKKWEEWWREKGPSVRLASGGR
ncbi:MAG: hypothetical protein ACYTFG_12575, partial [Planctomycetota bacterium]